MFKSDDFVYRVKVEVDLTLMDGSVLRSSLFAMQRQRIVDVMNDPRIYIPVELEDGRVKVFKKSMITAVEPLQQDTDKDHLERAERWQSTFARATMDADEACKILGLTSGASKDEIHTVRKKLLAALHPDLGGSNYLAAKINQAVVVLTSH